jgi:uroporphyrinogen decarboxylase
MSNPSGSRWPGNRPDFGRLEKVFRRQGLPDRVPFIELFADVEIVAAVLGEQPIYANGDRTASEARMRQRIRFCQTAGWDFVWAGATPGFTRELLEGDDTAGLARPRRTWVDESHGVIATMDDFEAYLWPKPETVDYFELEFASRHLPEGMRIIGITSGILEWCMWLMGYAPFAVALYDQPNLVQAMTERIGGLFAAVYDTLCDFENVGAVFLGDDMGHRSGTMIRPGHLRKYIFPQQRRLAQIAHDHGMPFLLHACGDLRAVMDDLIDDVGIDGKHSYEDTYLPVTEAKRLWGQRISILGGVDLDYLITHSEDEVRAYTRRVLEACMPGGGYALGTGNSVANYIPVRNYLAMLDEGMQVGVYGP